MVYATSGQIARAEQRCNARDIGLEGQRVRSKCILMCASKSSGIPCGSSIGGTAAEACAASCIRRSISRTSSAYSSTVRRSLAPRFFLTPDKFRTSRSPECSGSASSALRALPESRRFQTDAQKPPEDRVPSAEAWFASTVSSAGVSFDPRNRIRVRAAISFTAIGGTGVRIFDGELQRRQQRVLADLLSDLLIDGRTADRRIGSRRLSRLDSCHERRSDPVIRPCRSLRRLRGLRPEAAKNHGLLLHWRQRLHDVRQLVAQMVPLGISQ